MLARDVILPTVFYQVTAGLMEAEGHICVTALDVNIKNPVKVKRSGVFTGLTSDRNLLNLSRVKISSEVNAAKHGRDYYKAMTHGQAEDYRQSVISAHLVFTRSADCHMVIALTPVIGKAVGKALNALCEKEKTTIAPLSDNLPYIIAP